MRTDPRCPFCDGKVSAAAEWCMHCGRDFDGPVLGGESETDRGGGTTTVQRERGKTRASGQRQTQRSERGESHQFAPPEREAVDPRLLPDSSVDDPGRALRLLAGLGVVGGVATVGLDLPVAATGAGLAVLAWVGAIASLARQRSGFDAMRYGSYGAMTLLVFVSFALALAAEGQALAALLCTLVPVGVAALFVAGFGGTTDLGEDPNR